MDFALIIVAILVAIIAGMLITAVLFNTQKKGPNSQEVMRNYYRYPNNEGCYRYKVKLVDCKKKTSYN